MRTRRIAALVLSTLVWSSVPTTLTRPAFAQADDPVTAQARQRFKEGVEFYDKKKYEEARLAFLQAYTLKKHPAVLLNLAQSTAKAGHSLEAAKYFKQFLKESTSATPQQKKDAETGLADARQKLGRIDVVAPAGTEITLDDSEKIGTTPLSEPIDVEPGPHTIKSPTDSVKVIATVGQSVEAKLGASATAPAPAVAPIAPADTTATAPDTATAEPGDGNANVDTGAATGPKKTWIPKNTVPIYIGVAVVGVGLVGTIVFAAFRADAQSKADAVADDIRNAANARGISSQGVCSSTNEAVQSDFGNACATLQDNNDKVDTNAAIANTSAAVMVAGGIFTLVYWIASEKRVDGETEPPKEARPTRPILTPYGGWNNAGLSLSGQF